MIHAGQPQDIPGTTIFDGREAMKGYNLNKMCFSFNKKDNRDASSTQLPHAPIATHFE